MPVSQSAFNLISTAPAPNTVLALCQFIIGQNLQPSRNIILDKENMMQNLLK